MLCCCDVVELNMMGCGVASLACETSQTSDSMHCVPTAILVQIAIRNSKILAFALTISASVRMTIYYAAAQLSVNERCSVVSRQPSATVVSNPLLRPHPPVYVTMSGVSHRGADPIPDEPHGAADPNRNAFRSFWTAPAGPERPPQGMYDFDPAYRPAATARTTPGEHSQHHDHDGDDGHGHSHGAGGHGHSHGGGGHAHRLDENAPLLGGGSSASSSSQQQRVLGVFASYTQLLCCLIPLLLGLALLGYFLFRGTPSPPPSAPIIVSPPPAATSPVAAYCNPFALASQSVDLAHHHGLVAYLYLLPSASPSSPPEDTAGYRSEAVATNSTFFFSALDTPTRIYTRSFAARNETSGEKQLMPSQYFLLSFHTVLQPPATGGAGVNGSEMQYQLALISDDGSVLYAADVAEGSRVKSSAVLIDNDGVHTTRIAFSDIDPSNASAITAGRATNLTLHYFQGPPAHIALQLLYRPLHPTLTHTAASTNSSSSATDGAEQGEEEEETQQERDEDEEGNGLYWQVQAEGAQSMETESYRRLLERGWQVVPDEWYWLPSWYEGKEEVDRKVAAGVDPCL